MITIYDAELDIAHAIKNNSIALNLNTEIVDHELDFKAEAKANPYQIDLFYLKSILASIGWNENTDVFDKREMLAAYHTPVDKQFNFMHNEKDIIGHITSVKIYDGTNYLDGDYDSLPEKFDVVVGSVIYKKWQDEKLQARIDKLIAEIKENKWFVSMECLFRNFDYAFLSPDGKSRVVARTQDTAFLTKYLRAYGGPGEFKGDKIGRLLRDFSFSGKGLVDNPANKRSLIIDYSDISEDTTSAKKSKEHIVMADTYSKEQYDQIVARLEQAEKSAKDSAEKAQAKFIDELNAKIASLSTEKTELCSASVLVTEKLAKVENELAVAGEVSKNKDEQLAKLQAENATLSAKIKEHDEIFQKAALEKSKAVRLSKLAEKDLTAEKAQALVDKFITVTDEMFDEIVNSLANKKSVTTPASAKVAPVLDEYVIDEEPSLSVASEDQAQKDELRTKACAWFKTAINHNSTDKGE